MIKSLWNFSKSIKHTYCPPRVGEDSRSVNNKFALENSLLEKIIPRGIHGNVTNWTN